jgi:hypothetical protein
LQQLRFCSGWVRLAAVSGLAIGFLMGAVLQASAESGKSIELTEADLLASMGWNSEQVSVYGLSLWLTRAQAFAAAQGRKLKIEEGRAPKTLRESTRECSGSYCQVTTTENTYVGIDLYFDVDDHLSRIVVSVPSDAGPEVRRANVARKFRGATYQLFNNYSEALRQELLGSEDDKETHTVRSYEYIRYKYSHSGTVIHVTRNQRHGPPFDLSVDFVAPK